MELSTRSGNSANCVIAAKVSFAKDLIHIIFSMNFIFAGEAKWKVPGYGDRGGGEEGAHHHHHHHHRHHIHHHQRHHGCIDNL